MKPIGVVLVFLGGLAIGYCGGSFVEMLRQTKAHATELAAIDKLHQADFAATMSQDPDALLNLWSENGVKVDVPGAPVEGLPALKEMYAKSRAENPDFKVFRYAPSFQRDHIAVIDGWALESGDFEATFQLSAKDGPITIPKTQGVRLLKQQKDGSWKFAVVGLR